MPSPPYLCSTSPSEAVTLLLPLRNLPLHEGRPLSVPPTPWFPAPLLPRPPAPSAPGPVCGVKIKGPVASSSLAIPGPTPLGGSHHLGSFLILHKIDSGLSTSGLISCENMREPRTHSLGDRPPSPAGSTPGRRWPWREDTGSSAGSGTALPLEVSQASPVPWSPALSTSSAISPSSSPMASFFSGSFSTASQLLSLRASPSQRITVTLTTILPEPLAPPILHHVPLPYHRRAY